MSFNRIITAKLTVTNKQMKSPDKGKVTHNQFVKQFSDF